MGAGRDLLFGTAEDEFGAVPARSCEWEVEEDGDAGQRDRGGVHVLKGFQAGCISRGRGERLRGDLCGIAGGWLRREANQRGSAGGGIHCCEARSSAVEVGGRN